MGKFLNWQVLEWAQAPGPGAAPGPGPDLDRRGPRAWAHSRTCPFKNLPMKELAHEQELAHSNLAGVGWGGVGVGWGWGKLDDSFLQRWTSNGKTQSDADEGA